MEEQYSRSELLLGHEAIEKLRHSRVAVFGVGGVGGYAVEALARCGVGTLDLIDNDTVSISNLNRQIIGKVIVTHVCQDGDVWSFLCLGCCSYFDWIQT